VLHIKELMLLLFPWRYDGRNPYRRYCKTCGQQQDQYEFALYGLFHPRNPCSWESTYPAQRCAAMTHDISPKEQTK